MDEPDADRIPTVKSDFAPLIPPAPVGNRLLAALPRNDHRRFLTACHPVVLVFADVLVEPGDRIRHVYFPTDSFISLLATTVNNSVLEVGLVGDEGMLGSSLALGICTSPLRALVQGQGTALCMDTASFQRELGRMPHLQRWLMRYLYVQLSQLANNAACVRYHPVVERLSRWLLMTSDRAHSAEFQVTHEFLSFMLGVRRVGVTNAASALRIRKLIDYNRGHLVILDRDGLEAASCGCYQFDKAVYARIME